MCTPTTCTTNLNPPPDMSLIRAALLIALITTACASEPAARTDSTGVATGTEPAIDTTESLQTPAPTEPPSPTRWTVDEFGIGPLRAGMTVPEAARMVGGSFAVPSFGAESCTYATWREAPSGVRVMLERGLVARLDVTSGSTATSRGARIGDTEARVTDLYRGRLAVTPHKYTPGAHYMTVTPPAGTDEDNAYRLVFETDGQKVTRYRGGKRPAVEYVEGCG